MYPIIPTPSSRIPEYGEGHVRLRESQSSKWAGVLAARACALLLISLVCSGCAVTQGVTNFLDYNDGCNDFVMGWRNDVWARQAWFEQKQHFAGHQELGAFGAGFRDGYVSVASGGNGCPPPVPPRKYWTWKYQTPEGQCKVAAWFEGFSYGATAAEEHGAGNFQDIQVSYAIEAQYSPEFQAGGTPYMDGGIQFLYGQPNDPEYETLPGDDSTFEPMVNPQSRAGEPPNSRFPYVQTAFPGPPDANGGQGAQLIPREIGTTADFRPLVESETVSPSVYYAQRQPQTQPPFGVTQAAGHRTTGPGVSRLSQGNWPAEASMPASLQTKP